MPICKHCGTNFAGPYRKRFCGIGCQFEFRLPVERHADGCWEWQGAIGKPGYGILNTSEGTHAAHRYSYQTFVGDIGDLWVLHKCDNRKCVNPSHLFLGTQQDNMQDMAAKGRAGWANKKMPIEMRQKLSASHKARAWKPSQQQIAASKAALAEKMSDPAWKAAKYAKTTGENHHSFGKKMSAETRAKLQAYWDAGGNAKGRILSEETKQKMRAAALAKFAKMRADGVSLTGRTHSDEARQRMREASKKREEEKRERRRLTDK